MANGIVINNKTSKQSVGSDDVVNIYLKELESVVSSYDCLGSVRYEEYREFDYVEHEFYVKNILDKSPLELVPTIKAIEEHMEEFSRVNGIHEFYLSAFILFER